MSVMKVESGAASVPAADVQAPTRRPASSQAVDGPSRSIL